MTSSAHGWTPTSQLPRAYTSHPPGHQPRFTYPKIRLLANSDGCENSTRLKQKQLHFFFGKGTLFTVDGINIQSRAGHMQLKCSPDSPFTPEFNIETTFSEKNCFVLGRLVPNIKSRGARGLASKGGGYFTLNIYSMYGTQGTLVSSPHVSTGTLTDTCV